MSFSALDDSRDRLAVVSEIHPEKPAVIDDRRAISQGLIDGELIESGGPNPSEGAGGSVRTITFRELNSLVNRIAHGLIDLGFEPGERLVWVGRSSIEAIAVQHAVRKVGGYSIAMNHALTREEIHAIARVAEARFVLAESAFREIFDGEQPESIRKVVIFDGEPLAGQMSFAECAAGRPDVEPPPRTQSERVFDPILSFTSGTTGLPKGVVRQTLGAQEMALQSRLMGKGEGVFMVTGSLTHSGPNGFANNSLLIGNTVVLQRRFDPEDWLRLVSTYGATTTYSAPYMMRRVCGLPSKILERYDLSSLQTMIAAAAQWPFELKQSFVEAFPQCALWEIYGATELGSVTVMEPVDQLRKPGSCGRAVTDVEILLIDDDENEVDEPNRPGVLYAKSDCVSHGYLGAPELFEEAHRGDFMTVGDIAYYDEDGYYYICDRQKDMVISGGVNLYPREIENALERHPQIFECAVIGLPDLEWGERLHAFAVARDDEQPPVASTPPEPAGVLEWCRTQLASHKIPRSLDWISELPHTLSGKVDKKAVIAVPPDGSRDERNQADAV